MTPRRRHFLAALIGCVIVLVAAAHAAVSTPTAGQQPAAGPWYTAQELEALKAYSAMTFAEKKAFLAR